MLNGGASGGSIRFRLGCKNELLGDGNRVYMQQQTSHIGIRYIMIKIVYCCYQKRIARLCIVNQ